MSRPWVSVIIPVYNGERYLAEAIESILAQRYEPLEIIVVDDGSTDRSAEVVQQGGQAVRYIGQTQQGAAAARNHGVAHAQGEMLAFLDADDLWTPGRLQQQLEALEHDAALDIVFGHIQQFISPELPISVTQRLRCSPELMPGYSVSAMLIREHAFTQVGPFDTTWQVADFIDWFSRARERGIRSLMLPEIVARRRLHDSNMGIRLRAHRVDYVRVAKAALDRRRRQGMEHPDR